MENLLGVQPATGQSNQQNTAQKTRRADSAAFKAKVVLAAIAGDRTLTELAQHFSGHPNQITTWKRQLSEGSVGVFDKSLPKPEAALKVLHAKIGQLTLENDFFRRAAQQDGRVEHKKMSNRNHGLSLTRRRQLLAVSRSSLYYHPWPVPAADLVLMRHFDEIHLIHPLMGARMLRDQPQVGGFHVGRRYGSTLMKRIGIEALCRKPGASKKQPGHTVFPYLTIDRANQVWALDTPYIPMSRGFVYLTAVLDWRKVLAA